MLATERNEQARLAREQGGRDISRPVPIGRRHRSDHSGPRPNPFSGQDPVVDRQVLAKVEDRQSGPPGCDGKRERTELVA